jgi:lantibiotic modifying enzyme
METMFSGEFEDNFEEYGIKNTGVIKVEEGNDTSLLTGGISPRKSLLKPLITGTYSDPKIVWRTNSRIGYDNIPLLNGKFVDPNKYMKEFFEGYELCKSIILARKDEILERISNIDAVVRVILRPTRIYRHAILKSCYPQIYRKQSTKEFLQKTLEEYSLIYKIREKNLLQKEVDNLFSLVVPVFYSNIHSKEIICPNGEGIGEFKESLFESWRRYIMEILNEEYFNSQRLLIERSLE